MFEELSSVLDRLKRLNVDYSILFLDASKDTLVRRFKENRRKHPLCDKYGLSVSAAVEKERELLSQIRFVADYIIDTSLISIAQLKSQISDIFSDGAKTGINIICH